MISIFFRNFKIFFIYLIQVWYVALVGNKVLRAITTSLVANFSTDRALLLSERISRLDLSKITAIVGQKL